METDRRFIESSGGRRRVEGIVVMDTQLWEFTKRHLIVHFQ